MTETQVEEATPTRLMVIQGGSASCHIGVTKVAEWSTENDKLPFDAEYYRQVAPSIYDADWAASMVEQGRVFPLLDQPGD